MKFSVLSACCLLLLSCTNTEDKITKGNLVDNKQINNLKNMDIQYRYTILYVKDVPRTIDFYNKAFGLEQKFLTPENDYGEIISGATTIAFANLELGTSNFKKGFTESDLTKQPFGIELAFTTSEVEKGMERAIHNGGILLAEAVTKPWGQKVGYIRDINGFIIEICTPIQSQE